MSSTYQPVSARLEHGCSRFADWMDPDIRDYLPGQEAGGGGAGTAADDRVRIEARQRLRYGPKGDGAPLHVRTTVLYCPGYDTLVEAIGSTFHPAKEAAGTVLCFGFEECSFLVVWTPINGA